MDALIQTTAPPSVTDELPLITVRIPAYNHEKYIERCLDSVLEDEYPNKELVIINDGSTDHTDEIIRRWIERNDGRIPIRYRSRENKGLCRTLNELLELSRGEFLVSLASDDYLVPGGIAARLRYLLEHPDKDAVIGDCIVVDASGHQIYGSGIFELRTKARKPSYFSDQGLRREIICRWSIPGPVLMARARLYERIGRYNTRLRVEDWDLYLRMVSENLLGFIDVPVSAYRWYAESTSRSTLRVKMQRDLLWAAVLNLHRFRGVDAILLAKETLRRARKYIKHAYKRGLRRQAKRA